MKKSVLLALKLGLGSFLLLTTCSKDGSDSGLGACTVNCGLGFGITDFQSTQYNFISESDCKKKAEDNSCRAYYCPPTGNSDDCYRVDE